MPVSNQLAKKESKIYVIISCTDTKLGKLIRYTTKYKYNHVSLSLAPDLSKMYSFARYTYNNPLVGGFIEESVFRYYYKKSSNASFKIFELSIAEENYDIINFYIQMLQANSNEYIYNSISAMYHILHKSLPIYNSYTCIDFINKILTLSNFNENCSFNLLSLQEIDRYLEKHCIYEGYLSLTNMDTNWGNDNYYKKVKLNYICISTILHFGTLIKRLIIKCDEDIPANLENCQKN